MTRTYRKRLEELEATAKKLDRQVIKWASENALLVALALARDLLAELERPGFVRVPVVEATKEQVAAMRGALAGDQIHDLSVGTIRALYRAALAAAPKEPT